MPRFNMLVITIVTIVSLFCYQRVAWLREAGHLSEAMEIIREHGLKDVDRQTLFNAAMDGMAAETDRFSDFITREERDRFTRQLENHFPGIGIRIDVQEDKATEEVKLMIEDVVIGTPRPAYDAGLKSGDQIVAVNGRRLAKTKEAQEGEIPLNKATNEITGEADTNVAITVLRDGKELTLNVTRREIDVDSILGDTRDADGQWEFEWSSDPRIGYIRMDSFSTNTSRDLQNAIDSLQAYGPIEALILDLRNNGGGYLHAAVETCDMFVDDSQFNGRIVATRDRFENIVKEHHAKSEDTLQGFPVVVLVNGQSASASEIFAACLQDYGRAIVCGARTYGKGSVQQMFSMEGGRSILKLTTNTFWRPSNKQIHKMNGAKKEDDWGVRPDEGFEVVLSDEDEERRRSERRDRDIAEIENSGVVDDSNDNTPEPLFDPQLQRAVEYLQTKL